MVEAREACRVILLSSHAVLHTFEFVFLSNIIHPTGVLPILCSKLVAVVVTDISIKLPTRKLSDVNCAKNSSVYCTVLESSKSRPVSFLYGFSSISF